MKKFFFRCLVFEPDRIIDHFLNPNTWLEPFRPLFEPRVEGRFPSHHESPSSERGRPGIGGGISIQIGGGMGNRWKPWTSVSSYGDNYEPCKYGNKGGRKCHPGGGRYPSQKPHFARPGWGFPSQEFQPLAPVDPWNPGFLDHSPFDGCGGGGPKRDNKPTPDAVLPPETDRKDNETQVDETPKGIEQVPSLSGDKNQSNFDSDNFASDTDSENTKNLDANQNKIPLYIPNDGFNMDNDRTGSNLPTTVLPQNDISTASSSTSKPSAVVTASKPIKFDSNDQEKKLNDNENVDNEDSVNGKKSVMNSRDISVSGSSTTTESSEKNKGNNDNNDNLDEKKNDDKSDDKVNDEEIVGDESNTHTVKLASSSSLPITTTMKPSSSSSSPMFSTDANGSSGSASFAFSSSSSDGDILPGDKADIENGVYERSLSKDEFIKHISSLNRDEIQKLTQKLGIKIRE